MEDITGDTVVTTIPGILITDGVDITEDITDGVIPPTDGVILTTEAPTGPDTTMGTIMDTGTAGIMEVAAMFSTEEWTAGTTTDIPGQPMWCMVEPRVLLSMMPVTGAVRDLELRLPE